MNRPSPSPHTFRRWLDSFVALPDRLRLPLAILLALLIHGLVLLSIWVAPFFLSFLPEKLKPRKQAAPPSPPPLEVVVEPPAPEPEPAPLTAAEEAKLQALFVELPEEQQRDYLDVEGLAKKRNLSKRALLESWQDSVAGSRVAGQGHEPLPSQDGRTDLPFTNFKNQQASVGDPKKLPSPEAPPREKPLVVPAPDLSPIFTPLPTTNPPDPKRTEKIAETAKATPPTPLPTPEPPPAPTLAARPTPPPELKKVTEAKADEIPLFVQGPTLPSALPEPDPKPDPAPTPPPPKPTPVPLAEPKLPEPRPTPVPLATPVPKALPKPVATPPPPRPENMIVASKVPPPSRPTPVPNSGYTPHQAARKIEGGNPVGENGVDAVATNRGRYLKSLSQIVGSRWTHYVRDQASLITDGVVTLQFALNAKGKIVRVRVSENTSNSAHAALCERAFRESQSDLDPPPPELLRNGVFEDTFNFRLY